MTAAALVEDLSRRGVSIVAEGDKLRCRPRSTLSPADLELLRTHKTEILALLRAASPVRARCFCCKSTRFWRSIHGVTVCGRCHPPASPELVREWIDEAAS